MNKLLLQKRAEHQNHNNSIEYNHQKVKEKSPEKEKGYILSKLDETLGKKKFKLNYFNLQLFSGENPIPDLRNNHKFRNIKKIVRKEKDQIYVKEKKMNKKEKSKENLNTNNNVNKTEFSYNYNIHTNITKYFKNCKDLLNKKTTEIEAHLDSLWKLLGVSDNYINLFNSYKNLITNFEEKELYILNEIENLEKVKDIIINLAKEIDMRETKLVEIKNIFENINKESDINTIKKIILESNSSMISSYIENTIRVVEYFLLYKEIINQGNARNNKYNEETIKKNFGINKYDIYNNYLQKIKSDTNFINNTKITEIKINKDIFNIFKGDPFLSCLNNIMQLSPEIKDKIKYCQHCLIQEMINDTLNKSIKEIKEIKTNSGRKNSQSHYKIDAGIPKKNLNFNNNNKNQNKFLEESKNPEENINNNKITPNMNNINDNNNLNNHESNINDNLTISYYSGKISEFIPIYNDYYQKIPEEQKIIFNLKEDLMKYFEHNYYPKIIICKDKVTNIIKGLCIYSVLFKSYELKPNEIILEHISSYNKDEMENILTQMLEFIKANHILKNLCRNNNKLNTEIYINLYYFLVNEKFDIDKNIRDFISKKLKFKWVKLENISKVIRFQKMKHVINFEENENINPDNYSLCSNFSIKDNFIINFIKNLENINNNENNEINFVIKKINPYNFYYIIFILKKIFNIKKIFENLISKINNFIINNNIKLELISEERLLPLEENNNNDLNIYTLPYDLKLLNECFNGNLNDELNIKNKLDIFPLFDGCLSIKYANYFYNRIESKNIKILKEKSTEQKLFLIKLLNNDNISILISSNLNENFKNKYLLRNNENEANINISLNFQEIYNNSTEDEADENSLKNNYIYIPAFSLEQKLEVKNNDKNINEEYKIEFLSENLITKKNNKINNNFEFDIIEEELSNNRDNLINDEFMIFILDSEVIDNIGIMPIMSIHVNKDNFISCD